MSGIVGIWNLDGRAIDTALLQRLSAKLAHRGPDGNGIWSQGAAGLASHLLHVTPESVKETQPAIDSTGTVLVFDGRLDNRDDLLAQFPDAVDKGCPDADLVLASYQAFGDDFVEHLLGDFALGLYDVRRQRLILVRDALGIRPLYYCRCGSTFIFASEIKGILAHPDVFPHPNEDALADYLIGGSQNSSGLTCFAGIYSVRPAHVIIVSSGGLTSRQYWDFQISERTRLRSFQDYVDAFRYHFERAVRRRLRSAGPVAVSLSGGLDSSAIFCLAQTLRRGHADIRPVIGLSYLSPDGSPSDEKAFLAEIERQYSVLVDRVPMGNLGLMDGSTEAVWHVEAPLLDEQWNTTHRFLDRTRQLGARVILTGHWADQVLFDQAYLVDLFRHFSWRQIVRHLREYPRWFTDTPASFFRQQFYRDLIRYHVPERLLPYLRRLRRNNQDRSWYTPAFRRRARRITHQTARYSTFSSLHGRSLYREARSSHHVACMEWDNKVAAMHGLDMAFPFLDRDLLSFLISIPGEFQTWNGVPKALLREGLHGILPQAIARRTWKADFTHLINEGMERDYPHLVERVQRQGQCVEFGYVNKDAVEHELARLRTQLRGTAESAWSLSDLLGLELWLQVFFGTPHARSWPKEPERTCDSAITTDRSQLISSTCPMTPT
jgi:asparagine synthase (glutamine-hydrolysing)